MASKTNSTLALILALNILFFSKVSGGKCPIDVVKFRACGDLFYVGIGSTPVQPCCSLLNGLADLDAAVCLCTAIQANILGINLNLPISLSLLLNACDKNAPSGFQCS
ncbi:14 kDa proline-rich protein DC2.15 [Linum grandiflorum]